MSDEDLSDAKWLRELATENELSLARTERRVMNRIADRLEALAAENAKLREALGKIVEADAMAVAELRAMYGTGYSLPTEIRSLMDLAREALKESK